VSNGTELVKNVQRYMDGNPGDEDDMPLSDSDLDKIEKIVDERIKTHFGAQAVSNPNAALNAGLMERINATDNAKFAGVDGYKKVT